VTVSPAESVTVIPLTITFAVFMTLASCIPTVTVMGLPLVSVVLHCLARTKHPLGAMWQAAATLDQEASWVRVTPSGVTPEAVAVFESESDAKLVTKLPPYVVLSHGVVVGHPAVEPFPASVVSVGWLVTRLPVITPQPVPSLWHLVPDATNTPPFGLSETDTLVSVPIPELLIVPLKLYVAVAPSLLIAALVQLLVSLIPHSGKLKGPTKSLRVEVIPVPEERLSAKNVLMHGRGLLRDWKSPVRSKPTSRNSPVSMQLAELAHSPPLALCFAEKPQPPVGTGTPLTVPHRPKLPVRGSHCPAARGGFEPMVVNGPVIAPPSQTNTWIMETAPPTENCEIIKKSPSVCAPPQGQPLPTEHVGGVPTTPLPTFGSWTNPP